MTLHFLNEVVNDVDTKIDNYFIIASLKSEPTCKLINRITGLCLLISSLPGSASRMHVELLGKPRDSTGILKALPGKLDIKRCSPSILYVPHLRSHACNMYGQLSSEGSLTVISLNHHLYQYFKTTSSKCSCETAKMHRLI